MYQKMEQDRAAFEEWAMVFKEEEFHWDEDYRSDDKGGFISFRQGRGEKKEQMEDQHNNMLLKINMH